MKAVDIAGWWALLFMLTVWGVSVLSVATIVYRLLDRL